MVLIRPDLQELVLISLFDVQTDVSEYLINGLVKNDSSVFCQKYQMVNQYGDIMSLVNIFAGTHKQILRRKRRGIQPGEIKVI